ncbi:hypothetical protein [Pandoraea sp. NPDC087047]|uniref:hypothetical protein n=1 Tax=Pandoraea sp. NPDC087047 TaxID=3364390 RepID=UPI003824A4FF
MNITPHANQSHYPQNNDGEPAAEQADGKENNSTSTGTAARSPEINSNNTGGTQSTPNNPPSSNSTQSTASILAEMDAKKSAPSNSAEQFRYTPPQTSTININIDTNGDVQIPDYSLSTSDEKRKTSPKTEDQKLAYNNLAAAAKSESSDSSKLFDATKNFVKSMGLDNHEVMINISNDAGTKKEVDQFTKAAVGIVYTPYKIYSTYSSIDEAKNLLTKTDVLDNASGKIEVGTLDKVKAKIGKAISDNTPESIKKFANDASALKEEASNWYNNNPNAKIFLKAGNIVYGAYNIVGGTIDMYDAKDREAFANGAINVASGSVAVFSSFAEIGAVFGVGGSVLPIVSASAGVVGFALFAAGHAINTASMINDQNNIKKSDHSHEEFSYESEQVKKAEIYLEEKSDKLPGEINNLETQYGIKIGNVYTNNNKSDYLNSVNSDGNSSHGKEPNGSNAPGNDHSAYLHLDLNSRQSQSSGRNEKEGEGWQAANGQEISKQYGYSHSTLFSGSANIDTHTQQTGSPYLKHGVADGEGANLIVIDENEVTPPKEKKYPVIADTDRKDSTNDGHQMVRKQFDTYFNYRANSEYTPYPRSRQGQSKAGVAADNVFTNTINYAIDAYSKNPEKSALPPVPQSDDPNEWWKFFVDTSNLNSKNGKTIHANDLKTVHNLTRNERMEGMKSAIQWTNKNRNINIAENNHLARTETGRFLRDVIRTDIASRDGNKLRERAPGESARSYVDGSIQDLSDRGHVSDAWAKTQRENLSRIGDRELELTIKPSVLMTSYELSLREGERYTKSKQTPDNDPNPHAANPDAFSRSIVTDNSKQTVVDMKNVYHDTQIYTIGEKDIVRLGNVRSNVTIHVGGHSDVKKNESFLELTDGQQVTRTEWNQNSGHSAVLHLSNGRSIELRASDKERLERFLSKTQLPG